MYIVYKTTNEINGKYYVGIHKQEGDEFDGYLGSGLRLLRAVNYYGEENFHRETLFVYDDLMSARNKEREIVDEEFVKDDMTYNISIGGTGGNTIAGYDEEKRLEIKQKRMANKRPSPVTPENYENYKTNMLKNRIQPDNKGRKHTGQQLQNIIDANHMKGKMFITNGVDNDLIYATDEIPLGWQKGRTIKEEHKFKGHSEEVLEKLSKMRKNGKYINNGTENRYLREGEPLPDGWVYGTLRHDKTKTRFINNGIIEKKLSEYEELKDGWNYGRIKRNKSSV